MKRRDFIEQSIQTMTALALAGKTGRAGIAAGRVIVIGAGISGLAAARDLRDRGYDVVVVEGRNRIGGRI
ncbi:MAG: FAD-dependent oxidoreductase, partial [Acidobacteria bacterium]|nr:FAD-dependent oxidoreductase [Acidobacteriota bacterium]